MKFKKLVKHLAKIKADVPVRFYYPDLPGDFYLGQGGEFQFVERGDSVYTKYVFTVKDFQRNDWQIVTR